MDNLSGTSLKGYELQERIGAGGFGAVYKARQTTVNREVAIKIILPGMANRPDFIRRFETEAQLVARLEHPFIVPLHDYWRDPAGAYLVMRWLRGGSLKDVLEQDEFDLDSTARLTEQVSAALSAAHRNNVIHRDLKPGNILLDEDGNAYLADFGIAKDIGATNNGDITEPDQLIGSPDYLAPEQARSEPVTPQTDIYSLGVVLYELLAGEHPFPNLPGIERLFKHLNDPLPLIEGVEPDLQNGLNTVIQKATQKNPAHRYGDVMEMMVAFRQVLAARRESSQSSVVELLTLREQEILQYVLDGLSNPQIADRLFIAEATVKWYIKQIYKKLGVRSRVQAIVRARELHLIVQSPLHESQTVTGGTLTDISPLPMPENPYKGLCAFQSADETDFFGREKLTQKLLKRLNGSDQNNRFLAVVGPSGSGKSSLVKAGLIPALWRGDIPGSEKWFIVEMLPGSRPLDKLEVALTRVAANQGSNLHEHLSRDAGGLLRVADLILPNDGSDLVLIIDQFEEVFTLLETESERVHFLNLLYAAVKEKRSRVRVVVTLRADFYDRPLMYPEFGELLRDHVETVLPLTAKELESAILNPAQRVGVRFEEGLVVTIADEVKYQPGALPLLQYALTELFEHHDNRVLTHQAYQDIGGTVGALAKRAEEIYNELTPEAQETTRQMFLRLVTLGEGVEDTRRRTPRSELSALTQHEDLLTEIIDTFTEYRLLALDHDPGTRTPTVEVAHEAILREWERLRTWLNESRSEIRLQRQLAHTAEEWRDSKQDASFLLHGSRLEIFEKWAAETQLALTQRERDFLAASIARREQEQKAEQERQAREVRLEKRSRNFLRGLVAVLTIATVTAIGLSVFAFGERNRAENALLGEEAALATSEANSLLAERSAAEFRSIALTNGAQKAFIDGQPDVALALALEAVQMDDPPSAAEQTFFEVASSIWMRRRWNLGARAFGVAFSPDGRTAVTSSHDGKITLLDVQSGEVLRAYTYSGESFLDDVVFHPNGQLVAVGTRDGSVILWNINTGEAVIHALNDGWVMSPTFGTNGNQLLIGGFAPKLIDSETGEVLYTLEGHEAPALSTGFSPDESLIVTGGADSTVRVWDAQTGQSLQTLIHPVTHLGGTRGVWQARFLPDGQRIISGDTKRMMYIWDWQTGEVLHTFEESSLDVEDIAFSPDGQLMAVALGDGLVTLWQMETWVLIRTYQGHIDRVQNLAFNPDGKLLLSAAQDQTVILWDVTPPAAHATYPQGGAWAALAPSGEVFATSSSDAVEIWDIDSGRLVQTLRGPHTDGNGIVIPTFSPDSQIVIAANHDRTTANKQDIYLWDWRSGELLHTLEGHTTFLVSGAFSPDGKFVATGDQNSGQIILWDVATGSMLHSLQRHQGAIFGLVFSPDSKLLYSSSEDRTIRVWDVQTGILLDVLVEYSSGFLGLDLNSDGTQLVAGTLDNQLTTWDTSSGKRLMTFIGHAKLPGIVRFSPDDQYILSTSDDDSTLILWDAATGQPLQRFVGHSPTILTGYFSPDGQQVISMSVTETIIWDVAPLPNGLQAWVRENRYIPDFTCEQRDLYEIKPLCDPSMVLAPPPLPRPDPELGDEREIPARFRRFTIEAD